MEKKLKSNGGVQVGKEITQGFYMLPLLYKIFSKKNEPFNGTQGILTGGYNVKYVMILQF